LQCGCCLFGLAPLVGSSAPNLHGTPNAMDFSSPRLEIASMIVREQHHMLGIGRSRTRKLLDPSRNSSTLAVAAHAVPETDVSIETALVLTVARLLYKFAARNLVRYGKLGRKEERV